MRFYVKQKNGWLCYDCHELYINKIRERNKKKLLDQETLLEKELTYEVKKLYKKGLKPSEISKELEITTTEVYERLNKKKGSS